MNTLKKILAFIGALVFVVLVLGPFVVRFLNMSLRDLILFVAIFALLLYGTWGMVHLTRLHVAKKLDQRREANGRYL